MDCLTRFCISPIEGESDCARMRAQAWVEARHIGPYVAYAGALLDFEGALGRTHGFTQRCEE